MKTLLRTVTGGFAAGLFTLTAHGASLRFDGADDYVSVPVARIPATGDFTVECWARADLPPAFGLREIVSQGTSGNAFYIGTDPGNNIRAGDGWVATGIAFPFGGWHHFAVVKTSANAFLYVDGVLRATRGAAIPNPVATDFRIGRQYGVALEYWRGDVDEVRVWNTARSGAEIQQNMTLRLPGNTAGLVSCFHLDEGFGTSTAEATQNLTLGTLINGPTWNPIEEATAFPVALSLPAGQAAVNSVQLRAAILPNGVSTSSAFQWGPGSTALTFDGAGDKVVIPHDAALNAFPLTVSAWVKAAPNADGGLVNKYASGSLLGWNLFMVAGHVRAWYFRNSANYVWDGGNGLDGGSIDDGEWHHVTFTVDATGGKLYVDGALRASRPWTGAAGATGTQLPVSLGDYPGTFFEGQLDEITVWNAALSAAQTEELMLDPVTSSHPLYANLLGYWNLDEDGGINALDSSPSDRDGLLFGPPAWSPGARPILSNITPLTAVTGNNSAVSLDGVNDYADAPDAVWFNGNLTIEARVFVRSYNNWSRILDFGNGPSADDVLLALSQGGTGLVRFEVYRGATGQGVSSGTPLPLNEWAHVAVTLQGTTATLYLNGAVWASGTVHSPNAVNRVNNFIGRSNWSADQYANAVFDDVRIWNVALSGSDIRAWKDQPNLVGHPQGAALQAQWRFDETSGTAAQDSSSNARHATLVGGPAQIVIPTVQVPLGGLASGTRYHFRSRAEAATGTSQSDVEGFATLNPGNGTALEFDGHDDQVTGAAQLPIGNSPYTLEAWIKPNEMNIGGIVGWGNYGALNQVNALRLHPGGIHHYWWNNDLTANTGPLTDRWHHVAATFDGTTRRIYLDGVLVASAPASGHNVTTSANFAIGKTYNLEYFKGQIDEVRIWNLTRTEAQIVENMNERLAGNETGLVLYTRLDEGAGFTASDASLNATDLLLVGRPQWIGSGAAIRQPIPTTLAATGIAFGAATLNGQANGEATLPTRAWFEYGSTFATVPSSMENVVSFYNVGAAISALSQVNFNATPALVQSFTNINANVGTGPLWPGGPADYFAAKYTGRLFLPTSGAYTFYLSSDDGSQLYIDGALAVNYDGLHGAGEVGNSLYLASGNHTFEVRMFENTGGAAIILSYEGPGIPKQVIPPDAFLRRDPVYSSTTPVQSLGANPATQPVSAAINGLNANTTYHYRLVAANDLGTNFGGTQTLTMLHPGAQTALLFDGVNDQVIVNSGAAQTGMRVTTNLTVEAWIFPTGTGADASFGGILVNKEGEYEFARFPDGTLRWAIANANPGWVWVNTGIVAPLNQWLHVAFVYNGATMRLYTNGAVASTQTATGNIGDAVGTQNEFRIGSRQAGGQFFQGAIDEVRIWRIARSEAEIRSTLPRNLLGTEPGLLAYYRLDENGGTIAFDSGPNSFQGNHSGGPVGPPRYVASGARLYQPLVTTQQATPVLSTTATLRGTVNPSGDPTTVAYFEYGPSIAFGTGTTPQIFSGIMPVPVSGVISNLEPGTTYSYRLVAYNSAGTNFGLTESFTTLVVGFGWPVSTKVTGGSSFGAEHALDSAGNTYIAGSFSGSASFKTTLLPQGGSGTNAFVAKLSRGADWLWAANVAASANGWTRIKAVAADSSQNVYVAGQFSGVSTFGADVLTANNETNLFVAKLNSAGAWVWARAVGGPGVDSVNALAIGTNGSVYLTGQFGGTANFTVADLTSAGGSDVFVAKLDPNGTWLWARAAGGTNVTDVANALVTDASDNVYIAGEFGGVAAPFGPFNLTSAGGADAFIAKLNKDGAWLLARRAGSAGADLASSLAIDVANQLYLLGRFGGVADYNGTLGNLNFTGGSNLFVAKLNPEANIVWYSQGGSGTPGGIAADALGRVYVAGDFTISTTFGNTVLISAGNSDVFLAQLEASAGGWNWAQKIGASGNEFTGSLAVDNAGSVVLAGSFQNTIQVGYVLLTSPNDQDIFLARLAPDRVYEHNNFDVGEAITVPGEAQDPGRTDAGAYGQPAITILDKLHPDSDALNSFVWSLSERKLFAVRPVTAILKWPLTPEVTNFSRIATVVVRSEWPANPQFHVANAPVELEPNVTGFPYKFANLAFTEINGANVDAGTKQFNAAQPGWTVLQFFNTGGELANPNIHRSIFEVVRTVLWNDPAHLDDNVPVVIGSAMTRARGHNDPTGKNGYVYFPRSFYDGAGDERSHDRATRTGPIIPVNKDTSATDDDLVVVWYRANNLTGIAWPDDPVRYLATWPSNPDKLVIASGVGSGTLNTADFPSKRVYNQPDAALAGYNPNEEHAALYGDTLYSLRDDLNAVVGVSEPYTLLKYKQPGTAAWTMKVFQVVAEDATFRFQYPGEAGKELQAPRPITLLTLARESSAVSGPWFEDYNGKIYARAAGPLTTGTNIVVRWFYPLQPSFFYDLNRDGTNDVAFSTNLPLLDRRPGGVTGVPVDVTYNISWPTTVPTLQIGETLINAKFGLPAVRNWAAANVIFDQANPLDTNALNSLVRLFDPLSERTLILPANFLLPSTIVTANDRGRLVFTDLPYSIRARLRYDSLNKRLSFGGILDEDIKFGGPDNPLVLINVLSPRERDRIKQLHSDPDFLQAIDDLYDLTRNPNRLDVNRDGQPDKSLLIGLAYGTTTNQTSGLITTNIVHEQLGDLPKALTAGPGTGSGFVTLVENNDSRLSGLPVGLQVIRVGDGPFRGDLKVLYPDNVFDEKLTLRHSGDFGGEPQNLEFEWYYKPDEPNFDSRLLPDVLPNGDVDNANGWIRMASVPPGINGANDVTIGDGSFSSLLTLSDNWFICRYRGYSVGGQTNWSEWVGAIGGGQAQLAEGWVKRVIFGLNPFEARTKAFHEAETVTFASMLQQAGARYEGDIAFNPSADAINKVGLIAAYETVLRRAKRLSVEGVPAVNYAPANNALLLAAGRIADFYMLLGNEAYADAADPTIGFRTTSAGYGTLAPSIFTFQNQLDSLLDEELALLRGRDDRSATVRAAPAYNRLFWNFTKDQGEVAYAQSYNITDQNSDGFINAEDARIMFPQAHGDAWGHYLTATKAYYSLLRNPNFDWVPRAESILLAGVPVQVDYLDERKFARAAAAKAKTGAELVDLTYRLNYVDDPSGQWQGYKDTDPDRAWGLSEWGHRAGSGAYLDWVMANAILPAADPNTNHVGLTKIDRTTVTELGEIIAGYEAVQSQVDKADAGLNPLGLAKNVVPFDIDPSLVASGKTHFEQIYERAIEAMKNTVIVFDHANQLSQALRSLQDTVNQFSQNVSQQERDYKNRLIEIFGYPYAGDIGPGGTYPSGYDGADIYHYMYVQATELNGEPVLGVMTNIVAHYTPLGPEKSLLLKFSDWIWSDAPAESDAEASSVSTISNGVMRVTYPISANSYGLVAPASWGQRRAPGELQQTLSDLLQSQARLKQALANYDNLILQIDDATELLNAQFGLRAETINIHNRADSTVTTLRQRGVAFKITAGILKAINEKIDEATDITTESLPKVLGLANDATAPVRGGVKALAAIGKAALKIGQAVAEAGVEAQKTAEEDTRRKESLEIETAQFEFEAQQKLKELEQLIRQEPGLRLEALALREALMQVVGRYQATLARGLRLMEERIAFRRNAAGETQQSRYQDMTFRIFRNDAIQKYRAQFDLAAQYVFLSAVAYDYETQLLGGRAGAGRAFLTDIVRQRALGEIAGGIPVAGRHGLADPLARLNQNFGVLKGQLGFNNPQTETGRFSLRNEMLRLSDGSDSEWRAELKKRIVPNLWDVPEFRRYCRPFAPESAGPQLGLVIRFPTTITFGLNYFGWPLGGGDNAYDPTLFATKVRSAGVWFSDYNGSGLSQTPRVYLVPVGGDVMRSPSGSNLEIREWRVVDQKIPVPFPIGFSSLNNPAFIPINDALSDTFADIRRFSSFRAYHDSGLFNESEAVTDSRLIGRSVWNTDWMLIIPGGTFLANPNQGLDTFINSVSDILIFFQTYSYSGN